MSVFHSKKNKVFIVLGGFFITNAIIGEIVGGKLIQLGPLTLSLGILPWPIVFLTTDLINEYFGKDGVKRLTWITAGLIAYLFLVLFLGQKIPASSVSPITDESFRLVFQQTSWLILASLMAFVFSQFIDVSIFWLLRKQTGKRMIWLRATGSTIISQLVDTFTVVGIGFYLPGKLSLTEFLNVSLSGYGFKLILAIGLTPLIYLGHSLIDRYLGHEAEELIDSASHESLEQKS